MLATLKGDLQRRLRSAPFEDRLGRELEGLPFGYPALDIVQASFTTHLVERPQVFQRLG